MDDESPPTFIDPQRLLTTALAFSVGLAWNSAMREIVDDYLPTDKSTGALANAVLVTALAVLVWYMAEAFHTALSHFTGDEAAPEKPTADRPGRPDGRR